MATETLSVKIVANANNFSSTLSKMQDEIEKVNKKLEGLTKVGEGFKNVGKTMTIAGAVIVASVGAIVAKGAEWQSSIESTQFLYNNLDKSVQQAISSNSQNAKAIGLTSQQYKAGATNISTYYKNMGLTAQETAKLSGSTMDLVADLGAVADVPFDEALGDFKSALMGNYEAVDKYGISLSANALQNSEFVKGLGKSWNALSDNEKMMAAYNEMVRQGSSAQGLAKQEASSFAMQFKLLGQQIKETAGRIGSTLLPVLTPLVQKFSEVAEKIASWVEEHPKLTQAILVFIGVLGTLLLVFGPILVVIGTCITTFVTLTATATALGVGIGALVAPIGIAIGAIVGLIAFLVTLITNFDGVKSAVIGLGNKIKETWDKIVNWTITTFTTISTTMSEIWNTICNIVQTGVMLIGSIISAAFTIITLPFQFIWQNCSTIVIKYWNIIKNSISTVISTISSVITQKFNAIKSFITTVWNAINNVSSNIWNSIKRVISTVVSAIFTVVSAKFNSVKSSVTSITNAIKNVCSTGWNRIKSVVSSVTGAISSTVRSKFNSVKNSISSAMSSAKSIVSSGLNAISRFFSRCKLKLPHIKLPHFKISGSFSVKPPSVPKVGVSWYSKGAIFKRPSVLGGVGVGDKHNGIGSRAEAILPIDKLPQLLGLDNKDNGGNITLNIENFNNNREQDIKQLLRELEFYRKRVNKSVGGA